MRKLYLLMLLVVISFTSIPANAKEFWPMVRGIAIYGSSNNWNTPLAEFAKDSEGVWRVNNLKMAGGTEFRLMLHLNFNGTEWDEMWGSYSSTVDTLKNVQPGTIVHCVSDYTHQTTFPNFYIGHPGTFSFAFSNDNLDESCFQFSGSFDPAYFLSGEFNKWNEIQFKDWDNYYTLDFESDLKQTMKGQFLIIDQDYHKLGAVTEDDYYLITQDNPKVNLANEAQGRKNLCLTYEGAYKFIIDEGALTVTNWPVEKILASVVGTTDLEWSAENSTTLPLTLDESRGVYVSEEVAIPAGFRCRVLKHYNQDSEEDTWYGPVTSYENVEIPDGGGEIYLTSEDKDIVFTKNGTFTFTLGKDFDELIITGNYEAVSQYYLIGDFNNWSQENQVAFEMNDGVATLTQTFGGEFLVGDNFGNLLGGSTAEDHWWLYEERPSVLLTNDYQRKNIYLKDESEYTLTIKNGELTVSGWPVGNPTSNRTITGFSDTRRAKYINIAGQVSTNPFAGINIVVTTAPNGSKAVKKVIR